MSEVYSLAEVATHKTPNDCWIVVDNHVLNVTPFLKDHPGGRSILLSVGGKDASSQFHSLHKPATLAAYLPKLKIGTVGPATSAVTGAGGGAEAARTPAAATATAVARARSSAPAAPSSSSSSPAAVTGPINASGVYTLAEVAKHNSANDCWIVVDNHVLNVTQFLKEHPGGRGILLSVAGRDATQQFHALHKPATLAAYLPKLKAGTIAAGSGNAAAAAAAAASRAGSSASSASFASSSSPRSSPHVESDNAELKKFLPVLPIQSPQYSDPPFTSTMGTPGPLIQYWRATEDDVLATWKRLFGGTLPAQHGILDYWIGFQTKNAQRFRAAFVEGKGKYFDFSTGSSGVGGHQLEGYIHSLRRAMPDSGFDVRQFFISRDGTMAVFEFVWRGHWSGIVPGLMKHEVKDRLVYLPGVDVIMIDTTSTNHRLLSVRGYQDKFDFVQQVSMTKEQARQQNKPLFAAKL